MTEAWLRGPVEGVDSWLQPAAHALLHAKEDLLRAVEGLADAQLRARPGGAASVAFHLRHVAGATDRLLTYARGEVLSDAQKRAAADEREPSGDAAALLAEAHAALDAALDHIRATPRETLLDPRAVGRAGLPSTLLGLIFHAAEHAARHAGQALTTAKIARGLR
jgi:uncharacterized damage-inducible protein DinB